MDPTINRLTAVRVSAERQELTGKRYALRIAILYAVTACSLLEECELLEERSFQLQGKTCFLWYASLHVITWSN
jgi:hypothetical protein